MKIRTTGLIAFALVSALGIASAGCSDATGSYASGSGSAPACGDGSIGTGESCDDKNTASGDGCSATCLTEAGYLCTGSPSVCTSNDVCAANNGGCDPNAMCTSTEGSIVCTCNAGYSGDGSSCTNIDECAMGTDDCDANATCTDTVGSFTCACNSGFSGDGKTCADIDECATNNGGCDTNATCTNNDGSFACACNMGYSGDGKACDNIDECATNTDDCHTNATCTDTVGSFTCACNMGYSGDGKACADIDECATNNGGCDTNATCTNNDGSFVCACKMGYSGNGLSCMNIDECAMGTDNCAPNETCVDTDGSFMCVAPMCANPNGGTTKFAAAYGDASAQTGAAIAYDKSGNMYVAGTFAGSVNFGGTTLTSAGAEDVFVAKYSPAGQLIWAKSFGDSALQAATGIGVDSNGNVYVTGNFRGSINFGGGALAAAGNLFVDVFLAKLTTTGAHVWSKRFGDDFVQNVRSLSVDAAGNVAIAGYFQINVDFGGGTLTSAGLNDIFIAKFNASGTHQWSRRFGDAGADQMARAVTLDNLGNAYLAGDMGGSVDFGGGAMTATATTVAFVTKLDMMGNATWVKLSTGTGTGKAYGNAIAVGPNGEVAVGGSYRGQFALGGTAVTNNSADDAYVTLLSAAGAHTYTKTFGDLDAQAVTSVAIAANGDVLAAGNFTGTIDLGTGMPVTTAGGYDGFLVRWDATGCPIWSRTYAGALGHSTQAMALDPTTGGAGLTGSFSGTVNFGAGMLTAAGDDIFLLAVNP